jgi:hypothetical protein
MSNYLFLTVPEFVYDTIVNQLPAGFEQKSQGMNTYWYTNDTTACAQGQAAQAPITWTINGYNFTIPPEAYVVNFMDGTPGVTHLFNMEHCVLMVQPTWFEDTNAYGLGDAFLW